MPTIPLRDEPKPVVEPKPGETVPPATSRALANRIRQQEILAEIEVTALQGSGFERCSPRPCLTADGTEAEFCKILELIPGENTYRPAPCQRANTISMRPDPAGTAGRKSGTTTAGTKPALER
jgi:hypothetical protein